jgi:PAS domain S-box-containing protein/putative nucleotidyltransferase with HDIG domain
VNGTAFVTLIENAALLLAMAFVLDYLLRFTRRRTPAFKLAAGGVLGAISIAVMLAAWVLPSGVIFDTRSVVLSMGTLFYGTVPGVIGGVIAAAYRVGQGGPGAPMGVAVIVMSVVVGASWRRWRHIARRDPSVVELYVFGLVVHVCMLALTVLLPGAIAMRTLERIAVPVIVIYPLATVALGVLMLDQRRRRRSERALRRSEEQFAAFADHMPGYLWIRDEELRYLYVNGRLARDIGHPVEDYLGKAPEDLWDADAAARARRVFETALAGDAVDVIARWPDESGPYLRSHVFAMTGDGGDRLLGGLVFDVTEQQVAQQELERQAERLRRTAEGTVQAMSSIVERRDPYTAGHERRVAELAAATAMQLGFGAEDLEGLRLAAGIHDIGKISVPAEILSKPGRLNAIEFAIIKAHPETGYDVLRTIAFEQPVAEIVLQHHERMDGSGYPQGLSGDDILREARIIAVADVYEAMTSHRPYRPGLPRETAVAELQDGAGVRYDKEVVGACLRVLDEGFVFTVE